MAHGYPPSGLRVPEAGRKSFMLCQNDLIVVLRFEIIALLYHNYLYNIIILLYNIIFSYYIAYHILEAIVTVTMNVVR